ncbi:phosphatase PAP2 family protein [Rhodoferax sp.]|uniref:phosphatase PAP2 family protein n=1 Tax=Rhodoferax sp. TaxID=50421 RepID=UPI001EB7C22F|nr:phosphatase PAP2 family protein [Rhodoferax sp.]MBT9505739.1 phosphatase PAP2 family protein [Rhodoferax sp.]
MDPAVEAHALSTNRAALVGPFQGATLPATLPTPLDKAERLADWAVGPRMAVCELELLSGLHFNVNQAKTSMTLGFVDLGKKPLKDLALARLVRPTEKIFKQQLDLVANYAELREDRGAEILAQVNGGGAFWASIIGLTAHRHKYTLELLDLAMSLATHVEMRFKHGFACQRPVDLSPQIQPMIPTPGHASWPSGHATEAYLTCALLQSLLPHGGKYREQLERLAARIAVNRTVAGLHYPVDSAVGRLLGTVLADFMVARCTTAKLHERGFDGRKFHDAKGHVIDFDPRVSMADNQSGYYELMAGSHAVAASPLLNFMWTQAAAEWAPLQ